MVNHYSTLDPVKALHQLPELRRRDFLYVTTGAVVAVGAAFATWPFIDQMEPSSGILAAGGPISVDLSSVAPGQQIVVRWRSRPSIYRQSYGANSRDIARSCAS